MKFKFYRKVLKNGMTVIFEKRNLPIISVAIAVRVGGMNEGEEEKGISHFIEHMLYKGTPTRDAKKIADEIEKKGGDLNGFTSEAMTAYFCKMPSKHLKVALEVLSDMVKNPLFDRVEIEKERKVIFEEIKMNKDNPRMYVFDGLVRTLYEKPFGIPIIGTCKSMSSIDREKLKKRYEETYQPNNFVLVVVGDANFEKIINFAEKNFGNKKNFQKYKNENSLEFPTSQLNSVGNKKGKIPGFFITKKNQTLIEKRKGIDQANLIYSYHIPVSSDKKSYAAYVLSTLMAGGMSSRLFNEIREKRNLAYAVKGESSITKYFAHNFIYIGTTKENVEKVKKIIIKEFEKVSKSLIQKELEEVKEQIIGNYYIDMEESQAQMINLISYEVDGDVKDFYKFEKNIRAVKLADVKEIADKAGKKFSFYALVPSEE